MASKPVLISVFIVDLIAFGLAIAAELRRSTAKVTQDPEKYYNYCVYSSDIATIFGVGASFLLLISQAIIMMASRCFCCGKALKPRGSRACAAVLFMLCWAVFSLAEAFLLAGSIRNTYRTKYRTIFGTVAPSCETLREGDFAAGAAFIFFTCIFSKFYYVSFEDASASFEADVGEASVPLASY